MGRQAHITRLALGRSPFGEPLRDERGEFILGPHAHDNDAPGYVQQFDDRGHPQNRASKSAARRLRKAQNDVLATVGVVVKKGEERKSKWEKMDDQQKSHLVHRENGRGSFLKAEDRVLGLALTWYIASLRKRLMTFSSYSTVSIATIIAKEYHALGPVSLLSAGFPLYLSSSLPQLYRYYIREPDVESIVNFADPWHNDDGPWSVIGTAKWFSSTASMMCLELPLLVYSSLKSLHIVSTNTGFNWRFLIPFSATSPIFFPPPPANLESSDVLSYLLELLRTPLILYLIRDWLTSEIRFRLYALLRQIFTKPDRPDTISSRVFDENETTDNTSIAGMGLPLRHYNYWESDRRYFGPKSFFGALRIAFPPIYKFLNFLTRGRLGESRGRLSPSLNWLLQRAVTEMYWEMWSTQEEHRARGSPDDMILRQTTANLAFSRANLMPVEELVDPVEWTNLVLGARAEGYRLQLLMRERSFNRMESAQSVRSLREALGDLHLDSSVREVLSEAFRMMSMSDNVIINTRDGPVVMVIPRSSTQPSQISDRDDVRSLDAPEVTVDLLLEGVRNLEQAVQDALMAVQTEDPPQIQPVSAIQEEEVQEAMQPEIDAVEGPPAPPTPIQGISRAPSLAGPPLQPSLHLNLRPRRRPTETDDSLAALSQTLRAEAENLPSPRPSQPEEDDMSPVAERYPEPFQTLTMSPRIYNQIRPLKHSYYRVTMLSNHLADSLAWHTSVLLTSLILWPLEAFWLRAIADWALWNPAMGQFIDPWWAARLGFGVVGRPVNVLNLGTWFGGADHMGGKMRYMGSIMLTLGLEGMVRGFCWGIGVWCVRRWKGHYGWGQF